MYVNIHHRTGCTEYFGKDLQTNNMNGEDGVAVFPEHSIPQILYIRMGMINSFPPNHDATSTMSWPVQPLRRIAPVSLKSLDASQVYLPPVRQAVSGAFNRQPSTADRLLERLQETSESMLSNLRVMKAPSRSDFDGVKAQHRDLVRYATPLKGDGFALPTDFLSLHLSSNSYNSSNKTCILLFPPYGVLTLSFKQVQFSSLQY